jgi:Sugar (and other) transporter
MVFEFGPGPICWIYMSEVMNDKGVAVGTSLNWTFCLIYTFLTPLSLMFSAVFYVMGGFCGLGAVFVIFYVKETKDLTEHQLAQLYRSDFTEKVPSDKNLTSSSKTDILGSTLVQESQVSNL